MHPQVTLIATQQHIADLHRAADHNRLAHTTTTATSSHAVPQVIERLRSKQQHYLGLDARKGGGG